MSDFLSIRNYVHFRRYFDAVHPFFWPVLYWQLKRAWLCLQRERLTEVLLAVSWWGGVRIVYRGDKIETPVHDPLAPTKPLWNDPVWSTRLPACLATSVWAALCILLGRHAAIEGGREASPAPVRAFVPDTS
jgi:hypothetical protein